MNYKSFYTILIATFFTSFTLLAQNSAIEVVFDHDDHQFLTPHPSQLISVYQNKTLLVAGVKKATITTPGYTRIFRSDDLGNTWDTMFSTVADSFGKITDIYQTGDSQIVVIHSRLHEDTSSVLWKPKYYMSYTGDLCKTWTEYDLNMPLSIKPWYIDVRGSEVVFLTHDNQETVVWQSLNKGKSWKQFPLGILKFGTLKIIGDQAYALFADSILYFNDLSSPIYKKEIVHEDFYNANVIFQSKDLMWSARPKSAGIGNLQKTVLVQYSSNDGWVTQIDKLEDEKYEKSRRGLFQNANYKDEMMCFLGPNLFYSSVDQGKTWNPNYGVDSLWLGTRGAVCMKNESSGNYHVFYVLAGAIVAKYTIPNTTNINEPFKNEAISIFPNPSSGIINVHLKTPADEKYTYAIYATDGRKVQSGDLSILEGQAVIKQNDLSPGAYLLRITGREKYYASHFLVE